MKNLPKSLMGFLFKHGFKPFAPILCAWIALWLVIGTLNGTLTPLVNKWFISIFEKPIPVGSTLMDIALPTIIIIVSLYLVQSLLNIIRNVLFTRWRPKVNNHLAQT